MTNQQIGHRGEELVENYIRHNLIPTLQNKDAWTDIIYTGAWFKSTHSSTYPEAFIKFEEEQEVRELLLDGFYPTPEFLNYFKKLTISLSNVPDGFLIKMKRTGIKRKVKEAIKEYDITSNIQVHDRYGNQLYVLPNAEQMLPVVDGKIEVVEVKTGAGNQLQVNSYRNAVANGYPLRLFKVDLKALSIFEKVIVDPKEIVTNCFRDMSTFTRRQ